MSKESRLPIQIFEVFDDSFYDLFQEKTNLELLADGFQIIEGPVWNRDEGFLLFSDIPANRILMLHPKKDLSVFREPSGNSNGLTYDLEDRLIICEQGNRRVARLDQQGAYETLTDCFQGKRLNSPNDVVVKSDGVVYFTDPPYGISLSQQELSFQGVYRLDPENGKLTLLLGDFERPNGLAFSPDEDFLYISDSSENKRHVRVFKVRKDGKLDSGEIFAEMRSNVKELWYVDGMKVDVEGNLYVTAACGIWVYSAEGQKLGIIKTPETAPTNCGWGDDDRRTLYITARTSLRKIRLRKAGVGVR